MRASTPKPRARRPRRGAAIAATAAAVGVALVGCGQDPPPTDAAPATVPATGDGERSAADEPFVPYQRGEYEMVGPPVDASLWSLDVPSGGVFSGEASLFEFDQGEPDDLARRSIAVATGVIVGIGVPRAPAPGVGSEFPADQTLDEFYGGQVMIPVRVRIDDVLAGGGIEEGTEYETRVGAVIDDGELLEFAEDRLPVLGDSYLFFVDAGAADNLPAVSGQFRTTGVGTGRIPLAEAEAQGLLRPGRWSTVGIDLEPAVSVSTTADQEELARDGGLDGPVMYAAHREGPQEAMAAEIIGTLELDGDCLYTVFEGNRYPMLWPYGTTWDEAASSVVLPDGTAIALGGTVSGGGGYLYADTIDGLTSNERVFERAEQCAEEPYFEIAVMQTF